MKIGNGVYPISAESWSREWDEWVYPDRICPLSRHPIAPGRRDFSLVPFSAGAASGGPVIAPTGPYEGETAMAGEITITQPLTQRVYAELVSVGFALEIMVDCSHNQFVRTVRVDRPQNPVITKPIELDTTLRLPDRTLLGGAIARLQTARAGSVLFSIYQALTRRPGGVASLLEQPLKVTFPHFEPALVNLTAPSIASAVSACRARTADEFDALHAHQRRAMGMYLRDGARDFRLAGAAEPGPRTAYRGPGG